MSERPTKVPAIPAPTNDNLLEVARAVKGVIDVREGLLGEIEDSFVKIRDLRDAKFRDKYDVGGDGAGSVVIGPPGPVGPPGSIPPPDLTPPPAPTGLTADPSLTSIILQWDSPPIGYAPNHAYTEVWRFTSDAIGSAVLIGTSLTQFYTDAVGDASTGFYYWVRFVSKADVDGPYNATPGVFAQTSPSPTKLLNLLTGQIRDSHLFSALGAPIRRIDIISDESAAASLANSLSIHRESTTRRSALLSEALERGTDITEVRTVVAVGDSQLASRIDTLTAVVSSNNATSVAAIQSEATVRANADSASAVRIDTLEVSVNTPTALNNPTYAGLVAEAGVRAALDGSVQALYTVRTELSSGGRTVVGGFGLSGTATTTEGPRIDFGVRADRFWVGAPSSDSGIPDAIPFVIQTTPVTIGGESVDPGVYIDNAFIKNGSIGNAKVGTLTANKITAGYTASVDLEAGTFAGSEFYIGGTITYEFGNPSNPTQRTGIAAVAGANVALNSLGASFNVDYLRVYNGVTYTTPFEIRGGAVIIKKALIGDADIDSAKIYQILRSDDFDGSYIDGAPSADPFFSSVTLLMHCNSASPYEDVSNSAHGYAVLDGVTASTSSPQFGSAMLLGSSGTRRLILGSSTDFNLRSTFSLDFWVRWNSGQSGGFLMARSAVSYMQVDASGFLTVTGWSGSVATIVLDDNVNHRITIRSDGTNVYFYRDRILIETHLAATAVLGATQFGIFGVPARSDLTGFDGRIDEIRWNQGVDRYGGQPPVQAAEFPGGATLGGFVSFGTAGWAIAKNGTIVANNLYSRGAVAGGGFLTEDWDWPGSGGGFHIGPQGIRLGREASGQFFEASAAGAIRAPGLSIAAGSLVLGGDGADAEIRNTTGTVVINLNATGSQDFIYAAGGSPGVLSRITANGDAYFTNQVASSTWFGAADLIIYDPGSPGGKGGGGTGPSYTPTEMIIEVDTGIRVDFDEAKQRNYTARVGNARASFAGISIAAGDISSIIIAEATAALAIPFVTGTAGTAWNPGQNPYGSNNCAIVLRVRVGLLAGAPNIASFTMFRITQLDWIIDRVA